MLGWLLPRAPLDPVEKAWIETSSLWLAVHFGTPRILTAQVMRPDDLCAPGYDGTLQDARQILANVCATFDKTPAEYDLETNAAQCEGSQCQSGPETEQPKKKNTIRLSDQQLQNPYMVAATLARELAMRQLPSTDRSQAATYDVDWTADLAAVLLGWGVVLGHSSADELAGASGCGCGPMPRSNRLPARMLGYALALFAHLRDETRPDWKNDLGPEPLGVFDRSARYLRRTGDTVFTLDNARQRPHGRPADEVLQQLRKGSRSARVAALWELRDAQYAERAAEPVARYLHDALPALREAAARTLAEYGPKANAALPVLVDMLHDRAGAVRAAAALALGKIGTETEEALIPLTEVLRDPDRPVVFASALAIQQFGVTGKEAIPDLLNALRDAVVRCDHELLDTLTQTLFVLDPDPTQQVLEHFEDDPELRQQVVHIMVDSLGDDQEDKIA